MARADYRSTLKKMSIAELEKKIDQLLEQSNLESINGIYTGSTPSHTKYMFAMDLLKLRTGEVT